MSREDVAAVVVSYEPDVGALLDALTKTASEVGLVVVVDNGSSIQDRLARELGVIPGVELITLGENSGIATALNHGVRRLASAGDYAWVLTLDQDTLLHEGAVATALDAFEGLGARTRACCGVIGLRFKEIERPRLLGRWAERGRQIREVGGSFRERRLLLTSGNLVRREVAAVISYEDELFIDQVDYAFSAAVRAAGWSLLEYSAPLMDHKIGQVVKTGGKLQRYERGERLYYITRNSSVLLFRRQLPLGVWTTQLASWSGAYLRVNGWMALPRELAIVAAGLFDAVCRRLGRRRYRLLSEPPGPRRGRTTVPALSEPSAPRSTSAAPRWRRPPRQGRQS